MSIFSLEQKLEQKLEEKFAQLPKLEQKLEEKFAQLPKLEEKFAGIVEAAIEKKLLDIRLVERVTTECK
jgi:hypothetical protein